MLLLLLLAMNSKTSFSFDLTELSGHSGAGPTSRYQHSPRQHRPLRREVQKQAAQQQPKYINNLAVLEQHNEVPRRFAGVWGEQGHQLLPGSGATADGGDFASQSHRGLRAKE